MKVTAHELHKLRIKALDSTKKPEDRVRNTQRLTKLFLRRHGLEPSKYDVSLQDGTIVELTKKE